jgi:pectate lyase
MILKLKDTNVNLFDNIDLFTGKKYCRIRHGYAHVANNLYFGWMQYAIGGSMGPSLKSEANLFIAPKVGNKEVCNNV